MNGRSRPALTTGPEQGAVQVDAGLDPLVLEHGRGGGRAAEGVTEHSHAGQSQRAA